MSMKRIAVCARGISPAFIAETAMPAIVWVWMTQSTSWRAGDRAVDDEARLVDVVLGGIEQDLAVEVELDEARGVHLLVEHAVGIDEEGVVLARHPGRDVVGDHLVHAVEVDQAVRRGEIDALGPFRRAYLFLDRFLLPDAGDAHGALLVRESDAP